MGKADFLTTDEKRAAVGYGPMPDQSDGGSDLPPPERGRVGVGVSAEEHALLLARALKAIADDDIDRAEALLEGLLAKGYPEFNPDQARVPAGDPSGAGGQWSGGGGLGGDPSGGGTDDSLSGAAGGSNDRSDGDDEYTIVPLADRPSQPTPRPELLAVVDFNKTQDLSTTGPRRAGQFAVAVDQVPGLTDAEKRSFVTTFVLEGDGVHGGITPDTLKYYRRRYKWLPRRVEDFTDATMARLYKAYADDVLYTVGGGASLAAIPDPTAAAAFFDVLFQDGRSGGTRSLQSAVNAVLGGQAPVDPVSLGLAGPLTVDGQMGPATLTAFAKLAGDQSYRDKLLNELAKARKAYRRNSRLDVTGPRIDYLKERHTPPEP